MKRSPAGPLVALLVSSLAMGGCAAASEGRPAYKSPDLPTEARIDDLLPRMSLEEKVVQFATMFPNANVRLGIPHMKSAEALHGLTIAGATSFPQATAMGATWDPPLIQRLADVIAREARAVGVHQVYSPMIGVALDPRWGRSEESYGEDPYLVSRIGVAFINGLQGVGDERLDDNHIIATAKHYVAAGEPISGINSTDMDVSERRLHEIFLPPFRAAVEEARVGSIKPAHHAVNGVLMHANRELMVDGLRDTYGFDGHVISDNNDIQRLHTLRFIAPTWADAARRALEVGVDQELSIQTPWAERYYGASLLAAVESGEVSEALVDRAVRNVLYSKFRLGLFDDGTPIEPWQDYLTSGDEGFGPIDAYPEFVEIPNTDAVRGIDEPLNEYFNFLHRNAIPRNGWEETLDDPASDALALEVAREARLRDSTFGPLYRFGHGLSYTTFEYSDLAITGGPGPERYGSVRLTVTNTGDRVGDEVVQLYIHDQWASVARPIMELKGFQRVTIEAGASVTVTFDIEKSSLAFYNRESGDRVVEPGVFDILVGSSSADIRATGVLEVDNQ